MERLGPFHPVSSIGFKGVGGEGVGGRFKVRENVFIISKGTQRQTPAILKMFVHRKSSLKICLENLKTSKLGQSDVQIPESPFALENVLKASYVGIRLSTGISSPSKWDSVTLIRVQNGNLSDKMPVSPWDSYVHPKLCFWVVLRRQQCTGSAPG